MKLKEAKLICQLDAIIKLHESAAKDRDAVISELQESIDIYEQQAVLQEEMIDGLKKNRDHFEKISIDQDVLLQDQTKFINYLKGKYDENAATSH